MSTLMGTTRPRRFSPHLLRTMLVIAFALALVPLATHVGVAGADPTYAVSGDLHDAASPGTAISDVVVDVYTYDSGSDTLLGSVETTTDSSGHWSVSVPDGAYKVSYDASARNQSHGSHYLKGWWTDGTGVAQPYSGAATIFVSGGPVDLTADYPDGVQYLDRGVSFFGRVMGGGSGLSNASVVAYNWTDPSTPIDTVYTDPSGYYYITVPAGTYLLHYDPNASGPTWFLPRFYDLARDVAHATKIDGAENSTVVVATQNLPYGAAIIGYVYETDGVTPAPGVAVSAWDTDGNQLASHFSDGSGYYYLWPTEVGTSSVDFDPTWGPTDTSDSYNALHATHHVLQAYNHAPLDAPTPVVTVSGGVAGANDILSNGATITAHVTSPEGDPLAGMAVNVSGSAVSVDTTTDGSGNITVGGLPLDDYNLYARTETYDNAHNADFVNTSYDSNPVAVTADTVVAAPSDFVVQVGGRVTGHVTNSGTTPLSGIDVGAILADGNDEPAHGYTNGLGNYVIHGIPTDYQSGRMKIGFSAYEWNAAHSSPQFISQYWNAKATFRTADIVTVLPETTIPGINAKLATGSIIRGKITGPGGAPLAMAYVALHNVLDDPTNMSDSAYTDASGNYEFKGVAPGIYKIDASFDDGSNAYPDRWFSNRPSWNTATPITIAAGTLNTGKNIQLAVGAVLSGHVYVAGPSTPLANVEVKIVDTATGYVWTSTMSETDGSWKTQEPSYIAPGTYKVMFDPHQTNTDLATNYALGWYRSGSATSAVNAALATPVSVTYGSNVTGINASLSETGSVHIYGRVCVRGSTTNPYEPGQDLWAQAYALVSGKWRIVAASAVDPSTGNFSVAGLPAGQNYKLGFDDGNKLSNWGTYSGQFWVTGGTSTGSVSWPELATTITPTTDYSTSWAPIQKSGLFVVKTYDIVSTDPLENTDVYMDIKAPDGTWKPVNGDGYAGYTMAGGELDLPSEGNGAAIDVGIMPGDYRFRFERYGYNTVWYEDSDTSSTATTVTLTPFDPIAFTPTWVEQNMTPSDLASGTAAGSDRFVVGAALMRDAFPGLTGITDVVVASGLDRSAADPLSSAGLAGAYKAPLVLINQDRPSLPPASAKLLQDIALANPSKHINVKVVGGTASVPDRFRAQIAAALGGASHTGTFMRFGGADRYNVAAGVAAHVRARTGVNTCFLVNGSSPTYFWDALTVSPVAYSKHFPILLVTATSVPAATNAERGHYAYRYVIGNTAHVSDTVRATLGADRITGGTRADTAARFSETAWDRGWLDLANVAVGNKLADSLAGGVAYGAKGGPLLYTGNGVTKATSLDPATKQFFINYRDHVTDVVLLGGPASIDQTTVMARVKTALGR